MRLRTSLPTPKSNGRPLVSILVLEILFGFPLHWSSIRNDPHTNEIGEFFMGKTSSTAKHKWNSQHYTQVKVFVLPEIAQAFKERCKADGVSMAATLSRFMSGMTSSNNFPQKSVSGVETRPQHRKTLDKLIRQAEMILAAETEYRDRIPENLRSSNRYDAADDAVVALESALDYLRDVYL